MILFTSTTFNVFAIIVVLALFMLNIIWTTIISNSGIISRLRFAGHEMTYLSCGIVASGILVSSDASDVIVVLVTLLVFLVLWAGVLALTREVIQSNKRGMHPLTGVTLLFGLTSVWLALTGVIVDLVDGVGAL